MPLVGRDLSVNWRKKTPGVSLNRYESLWSLIHTAPQTHDLNVANWIARTKTRGAKTESLNVRLWLIADIFKDRGLGPLYPQKRTKLRAALRVRS